MPFQKGWKAVAILFLLGLVAVFFAEREDAKTADIMDGYGVLTLNQAVERFIPWPQQYAIGDIGKPDIAPYLRRDHETGGYFLQTPGFRLDLPLKNSEYSEYLESCLDRRIDFDGVVYTNMFGENEISETQTISFATWQQYSTGQVVDKGGKGKLVVCYANRFSSLHPNAFGCLGASSFGSMCRVLSKLQLADAEVEFIWDIPIEIIRSVEDQVTLPKGAAAIGLYERYYWGRDYRRRGGGRIVYARYILPEFDTKGTTSGIIKITKSDEVSSERLSGCKMIHVVRYLDNKSRDATYCNNSELP